MRKPQTEDVLVEDVLDDNFVEVDKIATEQGLGREFDQQSIIDVKIVTERLSVPNEMIFFKEKNTYKSHRSLSVTESPRSSVICHKKGIFIGVTTTEHSWKKDFKEENLIMNASENEIKFYCAPSNYGDMSSSERFCSIIKSDIYFKILYSDIISISFYKSKHGAFNSNPNEYYIKSIHNLAEAMHLRTKSDSTAIKSGSHNKEKSKFSKSQKLNDDIVQIKKKSSISRFFFKSSKKTKSVGFPCDNSNNSQVDSIKCSADFSDDSQFNWLDINCDVCYTCIECKDSINASVEERKFYFKLSKLNAEKFNYYLRHGIIARFPVQRMRENFFTTFNPPKLDNNGKLLTSELFNKLKYFLKSSALCSSIFLAYSTDIHGTCLKTLYRNCHDYGEFPSILLIKENTGNVFGAILSHSPNLSSIRYFGDGSCCVFRGAGKNQSLEVYRWNKEINYFIFCESDNLIVGAASSSSENGHAIWLHSDLFFGSSEKSHTFNSEKLSDNRMFKINSLEVWIFSERQ